MNIIGYVRVSTVKQAEEGVSIEMQKDQILRYCKVNQLIKSAKEIQFFIDDGYSGSSLARPGITQVMQQINEQQIDYLVAYDFSRISRNISDGVQFLNLLQENNISIECIHDDISILSASGRFSTNIKMAVNQYEREKIIERTNDGLIQVARSGKYPFGGKMMYGYRRETDNTLAIIPKEKKVIQSIFHQFNNHTKLEDICKTLNITHSKAKFTTTFIRRILTNERYTGKLTYKKEVYKDIIPAIITKEEYVAAQKILNKKTRKKSSYLFAGKIYCSCGNIMTCTHGTNKQGNKYYYYQCKPCKSVISENKLISHIDSRELELTNYDTTLTALEREYANYNAKLSKIKKQYVLGTYTAEQYIVLSTPLYNEQKKILQEKKALQAAGRVLTIGQIAKSNQKDYIDKAIAFITITSNNPTKILIKTK